MVDTDKFFIGPAVDITSMTVFAIRVPNKWGAKYYFEKVADRNT